MKKLFLLPLLVVLVLSGCNGGGNPKVQTGEITPVSTQMPAGTFGEMLTMDSTGTIHSHDLFADNTVTMVNIWATWCPPCLRELPDLGKLHTDYADKGFAIIGILGDAFVGTDRPDAEVMAQGLKLMEDAGASYTMLAPGTAFYNTTMRSLQYYPSTFFVDSSGNLIGGMYEGSGTYDQWADIVDGIYAEIR